MYYYIAIRLYLSKSSGWIKHEDTVETAFNSAEQILYFKISSVPGQDEGYIKLNFYYTSTYNNRYMGLLTLSVRHGIDELTWMSDCISYEDISFDCTETNPILKLEFFADRLSIDCGRQQKVDFKFESSENSGCSTTWSHTSSTVQTRGDMTVVTDYKITQKVPGKKLWRTSNRK